MKSLRESILDVDTNIDELEIPKKPTVSKKDYIYYLQAWYDVMSVLLDTGERDFDKWVWIVTLFKSWDPVWTIYIGEEDDELIDMINLGNTEEAMLKATFKMGASEMKWAHEYMDDIINDFKNGQGHDRLSRLSSNSILTALFGEDESFLALENEEFSYGPKYDKYISDITKALKIYGIKL